MDNPQDRISQLAATIFHNTERISGYLSGNMLPALSFKADPPLKLPEELDSARAAVAEATEELNQLMLGPKEALYLQAQHDLVSLYIIVDYGIAKMFSVGEETTFEQLAETSGLREGEVARVLRHAITKHIFHEPRKGIVEHTAASRLLAQDEGFLDWVDVNLQETWPAAAQTVNAMRKWPNSRCPAQTGFSYSQDTEESLFEYLEKYPERAKRFVHGMSAFNTGPGYILDYVVDKFPWASLGEASVVDVGGSTGEMMIALATKFPLLNAVVQDLPNTIAEYLIPPRGVERRINFMAHDFFTKQPVRGADMYFFRLVLHNWSDEDCFRILRAIVPALKPGARIIATELCLPPFETVQPSRSDD
ncbi:hypothetical protein ABVK25_011464 [Lepraria finkii]|uniref:O-methyltransferase C-terminal domain-containing protein n=1 Tax=Lepraria finkii TaxID=1340010 RepID=A0ABR4AP27_9LECA